MIKKSLTSEQIDFLTEEKETEIKNIYISEFNDLYPNIIKYQSGKFLTNLIKRVKLTLLSKFNDIPKANLLQKIENYIIETLYTTEYKNAIETYKSLKYKIESLTEIEKKNFIFNGQNFIKHCNKNELPLHICGNQLYINHNSNNEIFLMCFNCNQIYKSDMINMICDYCKDEFYTKIINNENNNHGKLQPATWIKYHCNAIINDKMKCSICNNILYIDPSCSKIIRCLKCNYCKNISEITFKCILCNKNFSSEAKIYNPLEFKTIKMAVKDALINRIKAIPNENNNNIEFKCGCKFNYKDYTYYHKLNCRGQMLKGIMNSKEILVCSLCQSLNFYDNYVWICPICDSRSGINVNEKNNKFKRNRNNSKSKDFKKSMIYDSSEKENENFFENENSKSEFKRRKNSCDEKFKKMRIEYSPINILVKNYQKNCPLSSAMKKMNISNKENQSEILNQVNIYNYKIKKDISPIKILKQKLISKFDESISPIKKHISEDKINKNKIKINNNQNNNQNNNNKFNADDYEIKSKIGEGSFGKIYKVEKNNIEYAMKKLIGTSIDDFKILKHEYDILKSIINIKKINVINIYGVQAKILDRTTTVMYILMELAITDWEKVILEKAKNLNYYKEEELMIIIKKLIYSFYELQKEKISHRDIKPQNILICKNNIFKIADFGEAKELKNNNLNTDMQTIRGTELFMSPILFQSIRLTRLNSIEHNTYKSDVFSLGFCLVFASTLTFNSLYEIREVYDMEKIEVSIRKFFNGRYSEKFIKLILNMLEVDEGKRMDFIELYNYVVKEFNDGVLF